jgi:hypothetical protein
MSLKIHGCNTAVPYTVNIYITGITIRAVLPLTMTITLPGVFPQCVWVLVSPSSLPS